MHPADCTCRDCTAPVYDNDPFGLAQMVDFALTEDQRAANWRENEAIVLGDIERMRSEKEREG